MLWWIVTVVGVALLGAALFYGMRQTQKRDKQVDPGTPSDDPSQGMSGHG